jgi:Na+-translocating ferredoxin:NAD+ oxidoreductase RnfE subunit
MNRNSVTSYSVTLVIIPSITIAVMAFFGANALYVFAQKVLYCNSTLDLKFCLVNTAKHFNYKGLAFWAASFFVVAQLQSLLIAVPSAFMISKGIEKDAARSIWFFVIAGVVCAAAPWVILLAFTNELYGSAGLFVPICGIGALAGATISRLLKYTLIRSSIGRNAQ